MNCIYRVVWSHVLNAWVAVVENVKGCGKSKSSGRKLVAAVLSLSTVLAHASPLGGQVVSGIGSINQAGNTTTISQASQNLALNWKSFNVASQETVKFLQPSTTAIAVNRIYDTNGTQILGHINANGQVWLINPNGILFGQGSQVNVGGLVASTLDISSASNGAVSFSGNGTGSVINQGTINGGYVALLGNHVSNQGIITAQLGTVALGAGSAATLMFNDNSLVKMQIDQSVLHSIAENGGLIQADGGQVIMTAGAKDSLLASVVNNTGVIEARTVDNHDGVITLLGGMKAGTVNVGGTLDASAPDGGNGGFIETSAAHVNIANDTKVTTAAASGLSGTWLIDPVDFTIAASGGDMTGALLSASLGAGNVTIMSTNGTTGTAGDVNVNDVVSWGANTLTLNAQNNININSTMNGSGTASLALLYGQSSAAGGTSTYNDNAAVNLSAGNHFSTQKGSNVANLINYTVITSLGAQGSTTATDLQGMNGNLAGHYALGSNIDATATGTWNSGAGFTPIGDMTTSFTGTFEGLGHTVNNITIKQSAIMDVGLFGDTGAGSLISNVGLVGGSVNSTGVASNPIFVGGLVGGNYGTISNSYATENVSATGGASSVGGLVGQNVGTINNSYASGNVSVIGVAYSGGMSVFSSSSGGLVGDNFGTISNSYAMGNVGGTGSSIEAGGLVGLNYFGTISNSHATGNVSVTGLSIYAGSDVGGLVGMSQGGTINDSYATGNVNGSNYNVSQSGYMYIDHVGGLVGINFGNTQNGGTIIIGGTISNSYATGSVSDASGSSMVGGLVGENGYLWGGTQLLPGTISTSYSTGSVSGAGAVGGMVGSNLSTVSNSYWNTQTSGQLTSSGGTGLTTVQMQTASNFVGFNFTTTPGATGNNWVMVDANGTLNNAGGASGATFPMLASEYSTTINNTHQLQLMAMAPASSYTLGQNINASNTATASGFKDIWNTTGGFVPVGNATTQFTGSFDGLGHSISNLTINRPTSNYVGLFGFTGAGSMIRNVGLVGENVNGYFTVGGLVGYNNGGSVSNSYATGSVIGSFGIGGLVGTNNGTVNNSYTAGNVNGSGEVGGLMGVNWGTINNSYATASVRGDYYIGGLAGLNGGTINTCYAMGSVSGTTIYVGGLVGSINVSGGTVNQSYWDTTTSGQTTSAGGTGLSAAQMQIASNFVGWDFTNVWVMGVSSPILRL